MVEFMLNVYPEPEAYEMKGVVPRIGEVVLFKGNRYHVTSVIHDMGKYGDLHSETIVHCAERL